MAQVKLNLVGGEGQIQYPEKPGDAIIITAREGHLTLCWCCPRCGNPTATARGHKHVYNENTKSLTPSIVHSKELGGCGYHGFLKNGIFTDV